MNPVTTRAPHHMVATADHLATQAGLTAFALGGNAIDAAIAANAAIAVTLSLVIAGPLMSALEKNGLLDRLS